MKFHYIYILQDLLGLLMIFLYGRLLIVGLKMCTLKGMTKNIFRLLVSQILLIIAGIILIFSPWALKTLSLFMVVVGGALVIAPNKKG